MTNQPPLPSKSNLLKKCKIIIYVNPSQWLLFLRVMFSKKKKKKKMMNDVFV